MKSTIFKAALSIIVCIVVCLGFTSRSEGVEYNYTELLPPGCIAASAVGINNSGAVVGSGYDSTGSGKGFLYNGGEYTEILPPGFKSAGATSINNNGVVVGSGSGPTGSFDDIGFIYDSGNYSELLPTGLTSIEARGINDNGSVVGYGIEELTFNGFLYSDGVYTEILPPGFMTPIPVDINNNGEVVGADLSAILGTTGKGFLYSGGVYTEILPPGFMRAAANSINNNGEVVGFGYDSTGAKKGFLYTGGEYTEILPPGFTWASASSINDSGTVVGYGADSNGTSVGFIAEPTTTLINLSDFKTIPKNTAVMLKWVTESEVDNAGFNLYRAEKENGNYVKFNGSLIAAKGSAAQGASYEFIDTNVQNRKTYFYKLEDIELNGRTTMHGPVSAMPRWIYGMGK